MTNGSCSKHEPGALELLLDDAVELLPHLAAHVVRPVPNLSLSIEHGVINVNSIPMADAADLVHLQASERLEAAHPRHLLRDAGPLLLLGQRDAEEAREPPHDPRRVRLDLLVLEEEDCVRPSHALLPVLQAVVPEGAVGREPLAEHVVGVVHGQAGAAGPRHQLVLEVQPGDERVLGVPAQVHDPAAQRPRLRPEQRHGHVRCEEPRGRERVGVDVSPASAGDLDERHEVLCVAGEERVVGGAEAVAGPRGDGEGEGLEPGGAALGLRGKDDVVCAGQEGSSGAQDPLQHPRLEPVALVLDERLRPPLP
ncbi:hypothetical protein CFC21_027463 [Triticum aestivum]|uniref:Uncharacterized protein n=2 Tax=Triticum aestivum TaxID=4565 RepID=A0A9R1EML5_WHEAT|nr:hypothetical protein CFC21_027463 [Triticum aestivum]